MSRDLENDYYITHGGVVPVKWTAPEVAMYACMCGMCVCMYVYTYVCMYVRSLRNYYVHNVTLSCISSYCNIIIIR